MKDSNDEIMALIEEDPQRAVRELERALKREPLPENYYRYAVALRAVGDDDRAERALETALQLDPEQPDAQWALAEIAFDRRQFGRAYEHVTIALRQDPVQAEARDLRARLRERRGDYDGAARDYLAAALWDPERFPIPQPLSDETIDELVESVLAELHPSLRRYLQDVPILVEEVPSVEVLEELEEGGHPSELLGCFTGHSLVERSTGDPWSALPATITLYRRNLARVASNPEELREELRITLLHEIGHFLGLDEDDLAERGLD